jgi:O-antigen ligase
MSVSIGRMVGSANTSLNLIGLLVFLPFIVAHHRLPIPSFYGEWLAAVLGLFALFPLLKREAWQPLEIPQIALIFVGFVAIVCIQLMLGMLQSNPYGLLVMGYLVWAFLLVVLGNYLRRQLGWDKVAITIAWGILAGGIVNIVFVGLQYLTRLGVQIPYMPNISGFGAIGQLNHFASYIALGVASLIYLLFKKRLKVVTALVIGLLFFALLAFSGSRSTWLYLSALAVLAALLRGMSIRHFSTTSALQIKQSRQLLWFAILLLPMFGVMQWLLGHFTSGVVVLPNNRLIAELGSTTPVGGLAVRLHIWHESVLLFLQSPWLGIGVGQTRWMSFFMLDHGWKVHLPGSYEHAHNLVLHLLVEMGFAGGLLLLAGLFAWLRGFQWKNIQLDSWYLLALLSIIGIHSMLEYPLWYAYFLGLTAFLLGAGDEKHQQINMRYTGHSIGRLAFCALLIFSIGLAMNTLLANKKLEHWVTKGIRGQINKQNQVQFYQAVDWVADQSVLSPYANVIYALSIRPNKKNIEQKLALNDVSLRTMPTHGSAYRHVLLLELNQQHEQAVQYLRRALQAFPQQFKPELEKLPVEHWDLYLRLFSEAIAKPAKVNDMQKVGYPQQPA